MGSEWRAGDDKSGSFSEDIFKALNGRQEPRRGLRLTELDFANDNWPDRGEARPESENKIREKNTGEVKVARVKDTVFTFQSL